jgi:DNA-directed RNA polymerase subunit RPC12/RpoP
MILLHGVKSAVGAVEGAVEGKEYDCGDCRRQAASPRFFDGRREPRYLPGSKRGRGPAPRVPRTRGERVSRWKTVFWSVVGATAAVVAGTFARRKYEETVLEIGHEFRTGEVVAREGGYQCEQCGYVLSLAAGKRLPPCPKCAHSRFLKIS